MALVKEFKEFAIRGSVVDLAVGIVIGTAFGAIVKSLVDDVIMPRRRRRGPARNCMTVIAKAAKRCPSCTAQIKPLV